MPSASPSDLSEHQPWRILIVGAAYGGMTALLHFIDLCNGKQRPDHRADVPRFVGAVPVRGVDVTVLDERDGFCMFLLLDFLLFQCMRHRCINICTNHRERFIPHYTDTLAVHSVGAPLAHVSGAHTADSWKRFAGQRVLRQANVHFVLGSMQKLDCARKSATYLDLASNTERQLDYDYVVVATGVRRQWPVVPRVSTHGEYVREGLRHVETVAGARNGVVVVVGGGMFLVLFCVGDFMPLLCL